MVSQQYCSVCRWPSAARLVLSRKSRLGRNLSKPQKFPSLATDDWSLTASKARDKPPHDTAHLVDDMPQLIWQDMSEPDDVTGLAGDTRYSSPELHDLA